MAITFQNIADSLTRISDKIYQTPIVSSALLNAWLGHEIYFKAENLQKVGAFKARGACNVIAKLIESGNPPNKVVAHSSGNHAQAVAWAANKFNIPATIYIPSFASAIKIQATKSYGAEVILMDSRQGVEDAAREHSQQEGVYWIPPYDHEDIICGQGTVAIEAMDQLSLIPDAVFVPCGGGGLLSGVNIAAKGINPEIKVFGAEPLNANDAAESLRKGAIHRLLESPKTIADGVMTLAIGEINFEYLKQTDGILEVNEDTIVYWTQWLSQLLKLQIEPTSAMTMGAVCQYLQNQKSKQRILVVLTGGNIAPEKHRQIWEKNWLEVLPSLAIELLGDNKAGHS
jgi:threo-3-hydroxy-L-aspartate ammonia-lyase